MEHVDAAALAPESPGGVERRPLGDALGTAAVALHRYRVPPGAGLPGGLHAHADQEEVFVVLKGEATFLTLAGRVSVAAGEAVRFAPGEFQTGVNRGDADLVVLAVGAPADGGAVLLPVACPDCGGADLVLDTDGPPRFRCPACGATRTPADCPACGSAALELRPGDDRRSVALCTDCGCEYDQPPVEGSW